MKLVNLKLLPRPDNAEDVDDPIRIENDVELQLWSSVYVAMIAKPEATGFHAADTADRAVLRLRRRTNQTHDGPYR